MFVHDLNQFVTVQLLEEMPAVLSLAKLCEDHGYSNEWTSGQKTHLENDRKQCKHGSQDYRQVLPVRLRVHLVQRYGRTRLMTLRQV